MRPLTMRAFTLLGLLGILGSSVTEARADRSTEQARRLHRQGVAHFEQGRIWRAIAAFDRGYRLAPRPEFLLNLAQCYRGLGRRARAIEYLRRFLTEAPDHRLRRAAEHTLAELRTAKSTGAPASRPTRPRPLPLVSPGGSDEPPPRAPRPRPKKHWRWIMIGAGVVVVTVGAVALGAYLGQRDDGPSELGTLPLPP